MSVTAKEMAHYLQSVTSVDSCNDPWGSTPRTLNQQVVRAWEDYSTLFPLPLVTFEMFMHYNVANTSENPEKHKMVLIKQQSQRPPVVMWALQHINTNVWRTLTYQPHILRSWPLSISIRPLSQVDAAPKGSQQGSSLFGDFSWR